MAMSAFLASAVQVVQEQKGESSNEEVIGKCHGTLQSDSSSDVTDTGSFKSECFSSFKMVFNRSRICALVLL